MVQISTHAPRKIFHRRQGRGYTKFTTVIDDRNKVSCTCPWNVYGPTQCFKASLLILSGLKVTIVKCL